MIHVKPAPDQNDEVRPAEDSALRSAISTSSRLAPSAGDTLLGFAYVITTSGVSIGYLFIVRRSASNDYYWPDFNTTATQTFLGDIFNLKLPHVPRGTTTTLAFNSSLAIAKDYSVSTTLIDTNPARARALLLAAIPLDQVIPALRTNPFNNNIQLLTPYCWVDFSRSFELAHSAIRQQRCLRSDIDNGAVYLDALLRNTPVADLMSSQYFGFLNYSVFAAVRATAQGQAWLATTLSHSFLDPGLEIQAWQQAGIVRWQSQLNNGLTRGIDETIVIENALGLRTTITVNNVGFVPMGNVALWTTRKSYVGFASEILYCTQYIKCSLVRSAPN
ncbi:hypothetical protein As57867_003999, partial [Aphanomyces stellatus]